MIYQPRLFDEKQQPIAVRIVEAIVMFPAIVGGLCMFFAMAWYCLVVDTLNPFIRVLVVFLMRGTAPLGPIVYWFRVYRRQTARLEMRIV